MSDNKIIKGQEEVQKFSLEKYEEDYHADMVITTADSFALFVRNQSNSIAVWMEGILDNDEAMIINPEGIMELTKFMIKACADKNKILQVKQMVEDMIINQVVEKL
jgi:hypothetical protein